MAQTLPTRGGFEAKAPSVYTPRKVGAPHTLEHRIYIEKDGVPCSVGTRELRRSDIPVLTIVAVPRHPAVCQ